MYFRRTVRWITTLITPLIATIAIAQSPIGACTAMVQQALSVANSACSMTQRNELCYGNIFGEVTPLESSAQLAFHAVGDVVSLYQVRSLELSPLDALNSLWGVALMQVQANLPDTLPGQNITFLMFGDVSIEDTGYTQTGIMAAALQTVNVRSWPSTEGRVLGTIPYGSAVEATGRWVSETGDVWLRISYVDRVIRTGWVYGNLFDVAFNDVPLVDGTSRVLNPMQAFYFRPGIGQTTCNEAPASGMLVQTPSGVGMVNFSVNGVDVALGSTALITMEGTERMHIALLEGRSMVSAGGVHRYLVPGTTLAIDLRPNAAGFATLSMPEPLETDSLSLIAMAFDVLPRFITLPSPAPRAVIQAANPLATASVDNPPANSTAPVIRLAAGSTGGSAYHLPVGLPDPLGEILAVGGEEDDGGGTGSGGGSGEGTGGGGSGTGLCLLSCIINGLEILPPITLPLGL